MIPVWIGSRYLLAGILLFALALNHTNTNKIHLLLGTCMVLFIFLLFNIIIPILPAFYDAALIVFPPLGVINEITIAGLYIVALAWMFGIRHEFAQNIKLLLVSTVLVISIAEILYSISIQGQDVFNHLGHLLNLFALFLFYKATIKGGTRSRSRLGLIYLGARQGVLHARETPKKTRENLERFLFTAAHDLRAPLRTIKGFTEIVLEDLEQTLAPDQVQNLGRIHAGCIQMEHMLESLISLARLVETPLRVDAVDLSLLAREIITDLQHQTPHKRVEWVIPRSIGVNGDPFLLRIVMQNLLENAWKFTSKHDHARIELGLLEREGQTFYFIRDDGAGFQQTSASKLFRPFQRLHADSEFPGTGIGLASVQTIINRHGGVIWGEGEIEKGATFYFTLPRVKVHPDGVIFGLHNDIFL